VANKNTRNRQRNKPRRPSARVAAATRARQRRSRQRLVVSGAALAVILAILAVLIGPNVGRNASSSTTTSTSTSTTLAPTTSTSTPAKSVKGKPCVAVSDPLPKGAPAVPVQTGAPPTKLVTKDLAVGTGAAVTAKQTLSVDYIGVACSTGKIFDSSYKNGKPIEFALSGVIAGWQQGIAGMKVGGTRLLGIPPALAYGSQGSPPDIAPDETLWFVVHVISAK
jgi:peptidylprolyl isomerase